jgi:hypothetical protein
LKNNIVTLCIISLLSCLVWIACERTPTSPEVTEDSLQTFAITSADNFFIDVPQNHWAHDYIKILFDWGYIFGRSKSPLKYEPDENLTRAEIAVFVVRGVYGVRFTPEQPKAQLLADVPLNHWSVEWVTQLYNDGYTSGTDEVDMLGRAYYRPEYKIKRAEACVYFLRMLNGPDYTPPEPIGIFSDVDLSQWYAKWIEAAFNEKLICPYKTFPKMEIKPLEPITRAMTAYIMSKAKRFKTQQNRDRDVSQQPVGKDFIIESELWNPTRYVNLATQIKTNAPNSQYKVYNPETDDYYPSGEYGFNLCGQICISMILETRTLEKYKLLKVVDSVGVDKGTGTYAFHLANGVEKLFPSWTKTDWWTFTREDNINTLRDKMIKGNYLIVLVYLRIDNEWGMIVTDEATLHWVVITGFSKNWNAIDNNSGLNWIRINNPFNNRVEYYPIKDFKKSLFTNSILEIF